MGIHDSMHEEEGALGGRLRKVPSRGGLWHENPVSSCFPRSVRCEDVSKEYAESRIWPMVYA